MNYHIEHHMYAAVPFYRLGRLHKLIAPELPPTKKGLVATWRQIGDILKRQKLDSAYQFEAQLPDATPSMS
jgi:fatty acid desaturase